MAPTPNFPPLECLLSSPPEQALSQGGKDPPPPHCNEQRSGPLAHKPWPPSQEADMAAGSGLGKW